jgi:hypothetical protein
LRFTGGDSGNRDRAAAHLNNIDVQALFFEEVLILGDEQETCPLAEIGEY